MSLLKEVSVNGREVVFFGTVKGLVSERAELRKAVDKHRPDFILVAMSPEEMLGLEKYLEEPFEIDPDDYSVIYAKKLERFGEVGLPVPTYLELFALMKERDFEVIPIDMPDEVYTEVFTRKIDVLKIIRHDMRKRKIWRMEFPAETPEEFAIQWDREVNRIREYMEVERERERYMAEKILQVLGEREGRAMVIVEVERMDGIIDLVKSGKV